MDYSLTRRGYYSSLLLGAVMATVDGGVAAAVAAAYVGLG
tara:strand:- start:492 stop:611 length:120 start_codon:yes stop_codon:yes gene_type:complete